MKQLSLIAAAALSLTALSYPDVDWPQEAFDAGMRSYSAKMKPEESTSGLGTLDFALVFRSVASADVVDLALIVRNEGFIGRFKATPLRGLTIIVR